MRAQGLPLNTIVLGAIAVLVLVVIAVAVVPAMGGIFEVTDAGDVTNIDQCEQNCRMLQIFTQYAYRAGPNSQYCADNCVGVAGCIIGGETVSALNCAGQCDSDGDCPSNLDTCCSGSCVNTDTDNSNCGSCGASCATTCVGGTCT